MTDKEATGLIWTVSNTFPLGNVAGSRNVVVPSSALLVTWTTGTWLWTAILIVGGEGDRGDELRWMWNATA